MPEVMIRYKGTKALQALNDFAKYFDFKISLSKSANSIKEINGVTIISGNSEINTSDLKEIFTGKNISAKELRTATWNRKK